MKHHREVLASSRAALKMGASAQEAEPVRSNKTGPLSRLGGPSGVLASGCNNFLIFS